MTYLECEVTGFVDAYLLANYTRHYFVPNASPQTLTYALFYHCTENPSV